VTEELRRLEERWADAIERRDFDTAEQLLASDFALSSTGGVGDVSREDWLAALREIETTSLVCDVVAARVYGGTAVVQARLRWDARQGERDLTGDYDVTDVFTRDDASWRASWRISVRL